MSVLIELPDLMKITCFWPFAYQVKEPIVCEEKIGD
jgi:hypothetical protein